MFTNKRCFQMIANLVTLSKNYKESRRFVDVNFLDDKRDEITNKSDHTLTKFLVISKARCDVEGNEERNEASQKRLVGKTS